MLNRHIAESTPARELCKKLEGRILAFRLSDSSLSACLVVEDGAIRVQALGELEPDAVLQGSIIGMTGMAFGDRERGLRSGVIEIIGDPVIARDFQRLLEHARPDLEEELSRFVGDLAAHQIGNAARFVADWGRHAVDTISRDVAEFLQEESRDLPTRVETDEFLDAVDTVRQDTDRLEARIRLLEARKANRSQS